MPLRLSRAVKSFLFTFVGHLDIFLLEIGMAYGWHAAFLCLLSGLHGPYVGTVIAALGYCNDSEQVL